MLRVREPDSWVYAAWGLPVIAHLTWWWQVKKVSDYRVASLPRKMMSIAATWGDNKPSSVIRCLGIRVLVHPYTVDSTKFESNGWPRHP